MFTGIVQARGQVAQREPRGGDLRLWFSAGALELADVALGDSIAVSGVCLTVAALARDTFAADLSNETLARTTLGAHRDGDTVNLEKALRLSDRLGGHLVSGHVDGVGEVVAIEADARAQRWHFRVPAELSRYIAHKGSICVDGVSLTVNGVDAAGFHVALIPHTIEVTAFAQRRVGDPVNIEIDQIARYVERLLGKT